MQHWISATIGLAIGALMVLYFFRGKPMGFESVAPRNRANAAQLRQAISVIGVRFLSANRQKLARPADLEHLQRVVHLLQISDHVSPNTGLDADQANVAPRILVQNTTDTFGAGWTLFLRNDSAGSVDDADVRLFDAGIKPNPEAILAHAGSLRRWRGAASLNLTAVDQANIRRPHLNRDRTVLAPRLRIGTVLFQ